MQPTHDQTLPVAISFPLYPRSSVCSCEFTFTKHLPVLQIHGTSLDHRSVSSQFAKTNSHAELCASLRHTGPTLIRAPPRRVHRHRHCTDCNPYSVVATIMVFTGSFQIYQWWRDVMGYSGLGETVFFYYIFCWRFSGSWSRITGSILCPRLLNLIPRYWN